MNPPYDVLMAKLQNDDFHGAIAEWRAYCQDDGTCKRDAPTESEFPYLFCANMLEACFIGKSMGGQDSEKESYHTQAIKLKNWIAGQQ